MGDVWAHEVTEVAADDHRFARVERHDIFSGEALWVIFGTLSNDFAVAHQGLVFFLVDVHRVDPSAAAVADFPQVVATHLLLGEWAESGFVLQAGAWLVGFVLVAVD